MNSDLAGHVPGVGVAGSDPVQVWSLVVRGLSVQPLPSVKSLSSSSFCVWVDLAHGVSRDARNVNCAAMSLT